MGGSRRSWLPSLCHPHPWGPVRTLGGTNRVGWIPNCEDGPPPNIGLLRFPRSARSNLVLPPMLLEALSSFSAFSTFRSVILVLRGLLAYGDNVLASMVSGGPKTALLQTKEYGALLCVQCVWGLESHEYLQRGG